MDSSIGPQRLKHKEINDGINTEAWPNRLSKTLKYNKHNTYIHGGEMKSD